MNSEITIFAPATVANVACGFDVMGFAIEHLGDRVTARLSEQPGVKIAAIHGDNGRLPLDLHKNTAGVAVIKLLETLDQVTNLEIEIYKEMPLASGMGSSAASAVAAVVAVNELLGAPLSYRELLPVAMEGETVASGLAHADNIAPALLGGIILIRSYDPLDVLQLPAPRELRCVLLHPAIEIRTSDTRGKLPESIRLKDALSQVGNFGALVAGLLREDYDLIGRSLHDVIAEPCRSPLIPGFAQIKQAALDAGAFGCSISGSGPSIFAFCSNDDTAIAIGKAMQNACAAHGVESKYYCSRINPVGAVRV